MNIFNKLKNKIMTRFNFLTIFLLLIIVSINQSFSQQVNRNYVVVEIGTYVTCGYCPGAAMGADDLVANGHQVAIMENHQGDAFSNAGSHSRNSFYGISGYPTAFFDGNESVVGGNHTNSMYPTYLPKYNSAIAVMSDFTMDMSYTHSGLDYDVAIDITEPGNYSGTNLVVHLVLTESHISYSWQGLEELNFVNRAMYPDKNGTDFTGGTQTINLSFTAEAGWNLSNCELVAFIQDKGTKHILQADKITLAEPTGTNNISIVEVNEIPDICDGAITPSLKVKNLGSSEITSLSIDYSINGGATTGTYSWTGGPIEFNSYATITMDEINFDLLASNSIDFNISQVNGTTDDDNTNNTSSVNFDEAPEGTNIVYMVLHTDNYGNECTWNVKNSAGNTLYSGGPYANNQTINKTFYLDPDCNTFNVFDSYGDGGGSISLQDSEGESLFYTNGTYGSGTSQNFKTVNSVLPEVVFDPTDGATNIPLNSDILITFNQPMRLVNDNPILNNDINSIITLTDNSKGNIAFSGTINSEKTEITINPNEDLNPLSDITVTILDNVIENNFDNALATTSVTFTTLDNTAVSQLSSNINIYPNPASDIISISNAANMNIKLFDTNGKLILKQKITSNLEYINIENLTSGIYFINIEENGKTTVKKITISK